MTGKEICKAAALIATFFAVTSCARLSTSDFAKIKLGDTRESVHEKLGMPDSFTCIGRGCLDTYRVSGPDYGVWYNNEKVFKIVSDEAEGVRESQQWSEAARSISSQMNAHTQHMRNVQMEQNRQPEVQYIMQPIETTPAFGREERPKRKYIQF